MSVKVLVEWGPRYLFDKLIPDAGERAAFLRDVRAAEANGFAAHHFIDAATLRSELTARGLL